MLKQIITKVFILFMLVFCAVPAWGLTLKVMRPGDSAPLEITLHATKRTERALAVKTTDGAIHYADMTRVGSSWRGGMFARLNDEVYLIGTPPTMPQFFVATTANTSSFSLQISAKGYFVIDWGDGEATEIVRTDTNAATYSHTYAAAKSYTIGIAGRATEYSIEMEPAISFKDNLNVAGIRGSLGAIFSTIGDGSAAGQQPSFYEAFSSCTNLTGSIPDNLFAGIGGAGVPFMFGRLFYHCTGLTGIPENLFAGIKGPGVRALFFDTFYGCSGIKTIPENLFAGVAGPIAQSMFQGTFYSSGITSIPGKLFANITGPAKYHSFAYAFCNCSSLTEIPENLFVTISGPVTGSLFIGTFYNCAAVTAIPENLFGNLSGPLGDYTFYRTFYGISSASGPSAKINGKYLYEIWPDATTDQVAECYTGATGLSDYANIPDAWK